MNNPSEREQQRVLAAISTEVMRLIEDRFHGWLTLHFPGDGSVAKVEFEQAATTVVIEVNDDVVLAEKQYRERFEVVIFALGRIVDEMARRNDGKGLELMQHAFDGIMSRPREASPAPAPAVSSTADIPDIKDDDIPF